MSRPITRPPSGDPVILSVPLSGPCRVQNSPADRIPSHGTEAFGSSHAIDLVPVDDRARSAPRTWRSVLATKPPEVFVGFGRPILAPAAGTVVVAHDGEPDHEARRSQVLLLAHLQRGSLQVQLDQVVGVGAPVASCGNSGNSTELHVHLQVSDSLDWTRAHGLPFVFRRSDASTWLPATSEIVAGDPGSR